MARNDSPKRKEEPKNPCERFPAGSTERGVCESKQALKNMRTQMKSDPAYWSFMKTVGEEYRGKIPRLGEVAAGHEAAARWSKFRGHNIDPVTGDILPSGLPRLIGSQSEEEQEEPKEPRRMPWRRAGGGGRRPSTRRIYRDSPWLSDAPPDKIDKEIEDKNLRRQFDQMRQDYPEHVDYINEWQKGGISPREVMSNLSKEKMGQAEMPPHPKVAERKEEVAERAEKKKWEGRRELRWQQQQEDREKRQEENVIKEWEDIVEPQVKEHLKPPKDYSETKGFRDLDRYYRGSWLGEAVNKASTQGNTSYQFTNELRNRIFMPDGTIDDRYIPADIGDNLEAQEEFMKMLELSINEQRLLSEYFGWTVQ